MLHRRPGLIVVALTVLMVLAGCGGSGEPEVTFTRDVAPIVFTHCSACHRPGGAGPFSLLSYEGAEQRARQMAEVTESRYMPPWLPEPGFVDFAGERRLSEEEIEVVRRWAEAGAPEGDPADLPPVPRWPSDWALGEPDLIVESPPFELVAEGPDVFRNFVLPLEVPAVRYVRAVEFRPEDPRLVHHAVMQVDRTGSTRRLDAADPGPGYGGMFLGASERPDGHFLGWTPGHFPREAPAGLAWRLEPGMDLVLQLHMPPSGRPEIVRSQVGLYFTDEPPEREMFGLLLGTEEIDIPPGESDHVVEDRFRLPAPVTAFGVYPHAHYLGERLHAWAELPDGERQWLIRIDDWDFDWQDEYRYEEPIRLPAGATVVMRYTYDNSAANPQNPHHPPQRVTYGPESDDEMAFLLLQTLPERPEDLPRLQEAQLRKTLEKDPRVWMAWLSMGDLRMARGDGEAALEAYRRALELQPTEARIHQRLGRVLGMGGRMQQALEHLRRAVKLDPGSAGACNDLGVALQAMGRAEAAERWYREALEIEPGHAEAHVNLARLLAARGRRAEAMSHLRQALDVLPAESDLARQVRQWLGP